MLLVAPSAAFAHAELVASSPQDLAIIEGTPALVELQFTEALTSKSSIELVGPGGSIATGGPVTGEPATMALVPPALEPGVYSVRWTAATDDGHIERGAITFTLTEPPPTPSPSPPPSATQGPTPIPSPSGSPEPPLPSPAPTGAGNPGAGDAADLVVLLAVAAVAIVVGFATRILLRGRDAA